MAAKSLVMYLEICAATALLTAPGVPLQNLAPQLGVFVLGEPGARPLGD